MTLSPYWQSDDGRHVIYCGDCLEVMRELEPGSVDAVVTDPPYGLNDGTGKVSKRGNELVAFSAADWDDSIPLEWLGEVPTLLRPGHWFGIWTDNLSVHKVWEKARECGLRPKNTVYWVKTNPPPQPRENFCSAIKSGVVGTNGPVGAWFGGGWTRNHITAPLVTGSDRTAHPIQKPLSVMAWLTNCFCSDNCCILDPFFGSGTTGVACVKTNRRSIGIEISEEYCAIAKRRMEEALAQPLLPLEVTP